MAQTRNEVIIALLDFLDRFGHKLLILDKNLIYSATHMLAGDLEAEGFGQWQPIIGATVPREKWLLVRGDSTMRSPKFFCCLAKWELYKDAWIDVQRNRLSDSGWKPEEWMYVPSDMC